MIERLEIRRMLDGASLEDGLLFVEGSNDNDDIALRLRDGRIIVSLEADDDDDDDSSDFSFDASEVQRIIVDARDGDDRVLPELDLPAMTINGGGGSDTLMGTSGNDAIDGGGGNDHLDGKGGADEVFGGNGFDSADYRFRTGDLVISLNNKPDDGVAGENDNIHDDVERIVGGSGNDRLIGNGQDNSITGNDGDDTVLGGDGQDSLDGDAGADSISGGDGPDRITGGDGSDILDGNAGDDTFLTADLDKDIVDGGPGDDFAETLDSRDEFTSVENVPGPTRIPDISVLEGSNALTDGQASINFGKVKLDGSPSDVTFTVRNDGLEVLTIGNVNVPAGYRVAEDLAGSIAPGESDTFTVRLLTSDGGVKAGQITIASNDGDEDPFNILVTGEVEVDPAPGRPEITVRSGGADLADGETIVNFGSVDQGTAGPERTFTVRNDGKGTLNLGNLQLPGFLTLVEGLTSSLGGGESDTFTVRLQTDAAGALNGQITLASNDSDEDPFNVLVRATVPGAPPPPPANPEIQVRQGGNNIEDGKSSIAFPSVVEGRPGPTRTFVVRNDGKGRLNLGSVQLPAGFSLVEGLDGSLAPGASDTFTVRLNSTSVGGKSGQVRIASNDANEDPFNFTISGSVKPAKAPEISVKAGKKKQLADGSSAVVFKTVARGGKPRNIRFTVRNEGNAVLRISGVELPEGFTLVEGLAGKISPGKSDTFTVRLETAVAGRKSGQILIRSNDANEGTFNIPISGLVAVPDLDVSFGPTAIADGSTSPVNFGTLEAGQGARQQTLTISNDGQAKLKLGKMQMPAGYSLVGEAPRSIRAGQSASLTLALTSRGGAGTRSGRVVIFSNDPDERPFDFAVTGVVKGVGAFVNGERILNVIGTAADDVIAISGQGASLTVNANGASIGTFSDVRRVVVRGGGGDDQISSGGITIPAELNGGDGNDALTGGKGSDALLGGAGDDSLTGGSGADSLLGEEGNDLLNAVDGTPDLAVNGGGGTNDLRTDPTDPRR